MPQNDDKSRTNSQRSKIRRLVDAFASIFRAAKRITTDHTLRRLAVVPFIINSVLFAGLSAVVFIYRNWFIRSVWAHPDIAAWYHYLLLAIWYIVYAVVIAVCLWLAYIATLILGGILASPVLDILSEKVHRRVIDSDKLPDRQRSFNFQRDIVRPIYSTAALTTIYVVFMGITFGLYLIPTAGPPASSTIQMLGSLYFLPLEFGEATMDRYNLTTKEKLTFYKEYPFELIGLGLGSLAFISIPILNLTSLPVLTVAATETTAPLLEDRDDS